MGDRGAVEAAQAVLEFGERFLMRDQVDLAEDRGDFHREVVAVRAVDAGDHGLHAVFRLVLAEDRLAELVEVHFHARRGGVPQGADCRLRVLARQDHGELSPRSFAVTSGITTPGATAEAVAPILMPTRSNAGRYSGTP